MDDALLLRRYAETGSEAAFAEVARRYVDLVYSAALRQAGGNPGRAQEVTQMVFIDLARKARALSRHPALLAWLHKSTRFAAAKLWREESRRRTYERAAAVEEGVVQDDVAVDWLRVRPVLDAAVDELSRSDREAVLLRFFANRPFAEIGGKLGLSENAARMRVERALAKLRLGLGRRGIRSTAAALAAALSGNAVLAAPLGTLASTAAAVTASSLGSGSAFFLMSSLKLQIGLGAAVLAAGASGVILHHRANSRLEAQLGTAQTQAEHGEISAMWERIRALREDNRQMADVQATAEGLRAAAAGYEGAQSGARALAPGPAAKATRAARTAAASGERTVYPLSQLDQMPVPLNQGRPLYPPAMKARGMDGQAVVEFTVRSDGTVSDLRAIKASDPAFADAAIAALQNWRYRPGEKAGVVVGSRVQMPVNFQITSDNGKWF